MLVSDIPKQPWAPEGLRLPLCSPRNTGTHPQDLFTLPYLGLSLDLSIPTVRLGGLLPMSTGRLSLNLSPAGNLQGALTPSGP